MSDDKTPFQLVVKDVIKKLNRLKYDISQIIVVFPSAVLIDANDIISALKIFKKNKNSFVISISKYPHPPQRAYTKSNTKKLSFIERKNELKNTQNFKELFHDGLFYIGNKNCGCLKIFIQTQEVFITYCRFRYKGRFKLIKIFIFKKRNEKKITLWLGFFGIAAALILSKNMKLIFMKRKTISNGAS